MPSWVGKFFAPNKGRFLRSIRLENFKAFKDSQPIPLRPITILVGKNSAGKSSIIKAILASSQTCSAALPDGSDFRLIGDYTNLGTFSDTVHGGDQSNYFAITFEIGPPNTSANLDKNFSFRYRYSSAESSPLAAKFAGFNARYGTTVICSGGRFERKPKNRPQRGKRCTRAKFNSEDIFGEDPSQSDEMPAFVKELQESMRSLGEKHYGDSHEEVTGSNYHLFLDDFAIDIGRKVFTPGLNLYDNYPFFGPIESASIFLDRALSRSIYLGPLRDEPSREARLAQSSGNRVGVRGEDLPTMLHVRRDNVEFMEKFNSQLNALGIAESARTSASYMRGEDGEELETGFVKVMVNRDGTPRSLMDLGFGTSQVLPIVFELSLRKNRIILLEQPELHLHPAAQSEIGDLLKFSMDQGNQLIVETHSANLIERIRRLIRNGELDNNAANIIYIRQDDSGQGICDSIGFNEDGTFADTWPEDDFFGEREREIFDW